MARGQHQDSLNFLLAFKQERRTNCAEDARVTGDRCLRHHPAWRGAGPLSLVCDGAAWYIRRYAHRNSRRTDTMSALAMILTAVMAVPGNGPEKASGEIRQGLDLSGEWEGTLHSFDGKVYQVHLTRDRCRWDRGNDLRNGHCRHGQYPHLPGELHQCHHRPGSLHRVFGRHCAVLISLNKPGRRRWPLSLPRVF